jgi:hypothetical protein
MFKQFNNLLALVLIALIITLWILQGLGLIKADAEISGATIATFTLVVQFYFRKAPPATPSTPASPQAAAPPAGADSTVNKPAPRPVTPGSTSS